MSEQWINPEYADLVDRYQEIAATQALPFRSFVVPLGALADSDEAQPE